MWEEEKRPRKICRTRKEGTVKYATWTFQIGKRKTCPAHRPSSTKKPMSGKGRSKRGEDRTKHENDCWPAKTRHGSTNCLLGDASHENDGSEQKAEKHEKPISRTQLRQFFDNEPLNLKTGKGGLEGQPRGQFHVVGH